MFKSGDKVIRSGCNHGKVVNGEIYTVKCETANKTIELNEVGGRYDSRMFKLKLVDPE